MGKLTAALAAEAISRERYGCTIPRGAKLSLKSEVEEPRPLTETEIKKEADQVWFFAMPADVSTLAMAVSAWSQREWKDWDLCPEFSALAMAVGDAKTADRAVRIAGNMPAGRTK